MRQQSWLPKCLRCSQSQSKAATTSSPNNHQYQINGGDSNSICGVGGASSSRGGGHAIATAGGATNNSIILPTGVGLSASISNTLSRQQNQSHSSNGRLNTIKSGTIGGGSHRHNIGVDRNNTLRGGNGSGCTAGFGRQTSPTSSAGSTHLIYNSATQPDIQQVQNTILNC